MENAEEVLHSLDEFAKLKPKDIPKELTDYLYHVALTGDPVYQWSLIKALYRQKLINVVTEFYERYPVMDIPPCPNVDPFNYETMKSSLLERFDSFASAPFTIQRISELLTEPRKQYKRVDKYMRAIEKNIWVVSTREPGRREAGVTETTSLVNGIAPQSEVHQHAKKSKVAGEDTKSDEQAVEGDVEFDASVNDNNEASSSTAPLDTATPDKEEDSTKNEPKDSDVSTNVKGLADRFDGDHTVEEKPQESTEDMAGDGAPAKEPTIETEEKEETECVKVEAAVEAEAKDNVLEVSPVDDGSNEADPALEEPDIDDSSPCPDVDTEEKEVKLDDVLFDGKRKRDDDDEEEDEDEDDEITVSPSKKREAETRLMLELEADSSSSPDDTNLEAPTLKSVEEVKVSVAPEDSQVREPAVTLPSEPVEATMDNNSAEKSNSEMLVEEENLAMEVDDLTSSPMVQEETQEPMDDSEAANS